MNCEIEGPFCEGEAVVTETPLKCCDNCFAWVGYVKVKPVPRWRQWYRAIGLFLQIAWRPFEGSRISPKLAWEVSRGIHLEEI